uniref:NADH-ubiquinone oxidoreductase chain 4L n=2 Tax=Bufonidae TaxID=8382 RepID=A0A6G8QTP0_ANAAE|nr:NADH dehydrogenase subunit 4L [Anaxyrus americanus]YP_009758756.1 NADH dehydrogenase subunit 4L [Bufotes pewzowi]QIN90658.1 NADH dehydrogenase subunit 4L [Anaxyrus americanus]QIN90671.1 NADH dehydrogenase subunit 4L [Bufotes pewzowi]
MMTNESWLLSSTFMLSLIGLSFHRAHLLSALLCLEGMMLSIFIGLSLWALKFTLITPLMYPIVMLTMSACEAGLGLSLMIATARSHGSDNLNTLNLLQC